VTDSVNDINLVRDTYRNIALSLNVPFLEVEIVCSDEKEHRHRVENRVTDIPGLTSPDLTARQRSRTQIWSPPYGQGVSHQREGHWIMTGAGHSDFEPHSFWRAGFQPRNVWRAWLKTFIRGRTPVCDDADDVLQEMTYQLMKVEQPVENVATWLFRTGITTGYNVPIRIGIRKFSTIGRSRI
jgi:hypothetical protein